MKKISSLLDLAELLTEDTSLISEVQLAENQPLNYLSQFANVLQERGIDKPVPELPWLAMVDGLARRDLLIELDWKDDPEELVSTALQLLRGHTDYDSISKQLLIIEPFIDEDVEEFIPQLNRKLESSKVQLIWLDIDSDSYPLTTISLADLTVAKQLAIEAGYGKIKS
ncbi:DUF6630 family protein [Zobellia sp. 1_MG-2023]|uniref:DUF6630 family protein n=1 Tax=Zobellia sp. 1_MG-2023 TaxID=3062626 RepID=UPI0026E48DAF|nr:DUF6630 family protein [Zobellia sp. 1_MG-2023]MDO6819034.1 hypothetical protein [Zobellia sp. 1_MG-2023]